MTVVRRRTPAPPQRRARRAPLHVRFPKGQRVQVREDVSDVRLRERFGTVVDTVVDDRDEIYPGGRVAVRLVVDELYAKLYGRPRPPDPIWIKPSDLDRRTE